MTHAETLTEDITSYVENYYPDTLEEFGGCAVDLSTAVIHILASDPPGVVMSDAYRADVLQSFANAYADMQRAELSPK